MVGQIKHDIRHREDILFLMEQFYHKLMQDELLRPIFVDIVHIDLSKHLPVLADFWQHILFEEGNYKGNPMQVHLALHARYPLTKAHFDTWLSYFTTTVDSLFEGEKAFTAKTRAASIAVAMQQKIYEFNKRTNIS